MAGIQADAPVVEPDADATATALAAAAATAPTTQDEAKAQIAAKPSSDRPEWLPEKFTDPAAMAKAYAELEAKLGQGEPTVGEDTDTDLSDELSPDDVEEADTGDTDGDDTTDDDGPATPAEAFAALTERFTENGSFDEDDYGLAEQAGYSREMVDSYMAGQEALAAAATHQITEAAGGKDHMDRMFAWAKTSMPAADIDRFNAHFQGNDITSAVIAMEQLKGRYEKAVGSNSKLLSGRSAGGNASDGFESWAQVTAAMSDPRYRTDKAYVASVAGRLSRSALK